MTHHCHANDCLCATKPSLFMCPRHWAMVSKKMQDAIWATYKARGGKPGSPITYPYMAACADAVEHVARQEGKPIENGHRRAANLLAGMMCDPTSHRYDPEFAARHVKTPGNQMGRLVIGMDFGKEPAITVATLRDGQIVKIE